MKKSKILGALTAAALAAVSLTALPVSAAEVDLDGTYHAYIGVQSASYTFRNAYDDGTYGYGITADDGTVWFDQLTGWDGPTALNKGGSFTDAEIAGNGTYSVSVTDFDFGDDETFNLLFVSSDIPLNDQIKISDVKVILDGQSKYTFDEAFMDPDAAEYMKWLAINIWNDELGGQDGMFGYTMPSDSIELQFTVSGFNYDKAEDGGDAAAPAGDGSFDSSGEYEAFIGVQSASYTFRNAYDDGTYGYGITADDGTVWFDQLTGWDGPTALNKGGKFTDTVIKGNGTYSVSVTDFDFGEDETFNLLFVSTNIPLNDQVKISDVKVILDGQSKYTFDEAFMDPDATTYMKWLAINIWNDELGGQDGMFGYTMPADSIELQFTVSGFDYDNPDAAAPEGTAAAEEETTAAEEETEQSAEDTAAETQEAASEETAAAEAAQAEAPASSGSSAAVVVVVIIIVVVIAAAAVIVIKKKKS